MFLVERRDIVLSGLMGLMETHHQQCSSAQHLFGRSAGCWPPFLLSGVRTSGLLFPSSSSDESSSSSDESSSSSLLPCKDRCKGYGLTDWTDWTDLKTDIIG